MSKQCKICTDRHEKAGQDKCPKCQLLSGLGINVATILATHAERIPKRAKRYLDRIKYFTPYVIEPKRLPEGIREHKARLKNSDKHTTSGYWCDRCNVALTRQSCLKCEMQIKGVLK